MSERTIVVPPPSAVREKLAENLREGRMLRRQYRLSMEVYAEPQPNQAANPGHAEGRGASR